VFPGRNPLAANIDVVTFRCEVATGIKAHRDVAAAGCAALEREINVGRAVDAACVGKECEKPVVALSLPVKLVKSAFRLIAPCCGRWLCCLEASTPRGRLLSPLVLLASTRHNQRQCFAVVFSERKRPSAVLRSPVSLRRSALRPVAVLLKPVVLVLSAELPVAVFWVPVVRLKRAPSPSAVLLPG
jgi:hypothetical protein